jgi:hypothetical protein
MFFAVIIGAAVNLGVPVLVAIKLLTLTRKTGDEEFCSTSFALTPLRLATRRGYRGRVFRRHFV